MSNTTDSFQASNFENENSDLAENELNFDELDSINGGSLMREVGKLKGKADAAPGKIARKVGRKVGQGVKDYREGYKEGRK